MIVIVTPSTRLGILSGINTLKIICAFVEPIDLAARITPGSISFKAVSTRRATKGAAAIVNGMIVASVPIALPTIISIAILSLMGAWNSYVWPNLIASGTNPYFGNSMKLVSNGLMDMFTNSLTGESNDTAKMAAALLVTVPLFIFFLIFQKRGCEIFDKCLTAPIFAVILKVLLIWINILLKPFNGERTAYDKGYLSR